MAVNRDPAALAISPTPTVHEDRRKPFCRPSRSSDEPDRGLDTPPLLSLDGDTRNRRTPRCPSHRGLPSQSHRSRSPRPALPKVLNVEQAQSFLEPILTKNNRGGNLQDPPLSACFGLANGVGTGKLAATEIDRLPPKDYEQQELGNVFRLQRRA